MDERAIKTIIYLVKCLNYIEKAFFSRKLRKEAKIERAETLLAKLGENDFNRIKQAL